MNIEEKTKVFCNAWQSISIMMQVALGAAIMTYTGQNMGAGKQDRISLGVIAAMKISAVVSELQTCF